ncbi:penicillin-binding transpeptidase domain-containing protein [Paenibacillus sp. FJAT-26967]|uniref:penicillin-binding transpeptidase domain-containing protein n=1 Tax=Paenibacillus sp. FJAT-26967 TaxID=1729690 RepID=UPI000838BD8A|nr:penicillin-binding transpeptidase domain-containing protein [Paenibacillus sp. FJAT-26967]
MSKIKVLLGCLAAVLLVALWGGTSTGYAQKTQMMKNEKEPVYLYEDLSEYFKGYSGTFLLLDIKKNRYTIYNEEQSEKAVSPASTFKIPHALIGLETGVLHNANTTFRWDGTVYPFVNWNEDQTLATSISRSVIWYFQRVAEQVGVKKEQYYLDAIQYGNRDISGGLTEFWLQSSLTISPREQLEFLKKFYSYKLPFAKCNIDAVKQMIILDKNKKAVLSGKTGTGWADNVINGTPVNGWFIGYVEKNHNVYLFVTNIQASGQASSSKAKEITLKILADKKIYIK